ncbi:MAG: hemolysin family protein [Acidobacteria bacterium]|nr:hemolysin family protein [Acidobacteriota bacterium]MBU4307515.1 hemolysin family protein [Acidobacteriota bacterium]MBU4404556.1 hemolysin family protein [Acidobacteriota bacterium]MCG2810898.1 hemolysin family protein [Candidatus Aminicenantes bacterium]
MNLAALIALYIVTILLHLLKSSFESFSRISLAKFLNGMGNKRLPRFAFVEKFDLVIHSLETVVFFLQIVLLIFTFQMLEKAIPAAPGRILLIGLLYLFFFNLVFYISAYLNREKVLRGLLFLFPVAWVVFYPLNYIFSLFLKESPVESSDDEDEELSDEQLEMFLEEGAKEGVIEKEDQEMIESVLEFGDTLVKEIMTPRVDMVHVHIDASLDEIIAIIRKNKKSRFPVIAEKIDNIEGIILAKDVLNYWGRSDFNIKEILRPPFFIPETMRILELLKEMQKTKQKFAIVSDEFGGVVGVISMEDIMEEIVGDIKDEYDDDSEPIIRDRDGFIVQGDIDIYELNEALQIEIDENEDYQTVAGLISFKLGKIPQPQDKITVEGYILEVKEMEKNRIKTVRIYHEKR